MTNLPKSIPGKMGSGKGRGKTGGGYCGEVKIFIGIALIGWAMDPAIKKTASFNRVDFFGD